jgi:hypothetical protein
MTDQTLHALIDAFVRDNYRRNAWLYGDVLHGYFRKTPRFLLNTSHRCLDVANVNINNPRHRRQGVFRAVLAHIEAYRDSIYVENVQDSWLADSLLRRGYRCVDDNWPSSYIKLAAATPVA